MELGSRQVSDLASVRGGSEQQKCSSPLVSYTEQFVKHLPFYLSIGMTYDQYWNDDPELTKFYLQAYKLQRSRRNEELWRQGAYIYNAICAASPIFHPFAPRGTTAQPYLSEPFPLTKQEAEEQERRKMIEAAARFQDFVDMKNAERRAKNGKDND